MNQKMKQTSNDTWKCAKVFRPAALWIGLLVLLVLGSRGALAQLSTDDIIGTVSDATGAVVSQATVTLVNLDTQDQRVALSNDSGDFQFAQLPPGHYSVTAKRENFKTATLNLSVEAGDRARADIHLQTGGISETVVVEGTTPLLQADNATVSSTVTETAVQDLPRN